MTLAPDKQALKRAARDLVKAVGGQEAAAGFCRVGQPRLSGYGNVDQSDQHMPIDVVADLEAATRGLPGAPHVTRMLAQLAGFGLMPLPAAKPEGKSWPQHIADLSKESGEIIAKIAMASADGAIGRQDIRQGDLLREAHELLHAVVDLVAALDAVEADTS